MAQTPIKGIARWLAKPRPKACNRLDCRNEAVFALPDGYWYCSVECSELDAAEQAAWPLLPEGWPSTRRGR